MIHEKPIEVQSIFIRQANPSELPELVIVYGNTCQPIILRPNMTRRLALEAAQIALNGSSLSQSPMRTFGKLAAG